MIDRPFAVPENARLPVPRGFARGLVLASVFVCAACGLVYELELVALAAYLVGDSVTQASVVLSVMVFAMGVGSLLAKRLRGWAAMGFGYVEALLALVGGCSAMALYACFAWFGEARSALVLISFAIGLLIGAEMPLLMTLIQRIRQQDAGGAVADLFAADYVGALVGGLTFPFLLLPFFGQLTGALLTGVVNVVAGGVVVLWLFHRDLTRRVRWALAAANGAVVLLLVVGMASAGAFEQAARRAVYGEDVRVAVHTNVQELVLTGGARPGTPPSAPVPVPGTGVGAVPSAASGSGPGSASGSVLDSVSGAAYRKGKSQERRGAGDTAPLEFFLDGRLRVCSADEARYHESLVHPAMGVGPRARVLILGGGDGLALREVLRYADVRSATVVELDPGVTALARTDPGLRRLNQGAHDNPRAHLRTADPFNWLREHAASRAAVPYDVIISDLPDPGITPSTKLYSQEFYGLASRALAPGGRLAVHAGAPSARPGDYWTVERTMRSVGLRTSPYVVDGRLSGFSSGPDRSLQEDEPPEGVAAENGGRVAHPRDWGFVLASRGGAAATGARAGAGAATGGGGARRGVPGAPQLRAVTAAELREARVRAERGRMTGLPPSSLMHPRYLE